MCCLLYLIRRRAARNRAQARDQEKEPFLDSEPRRRGGIDRRGRRGRGGISRRGDTGMRRSGDVEDVHRLGSG